MTGLGDAIAYSIVVLAIIAVVVGGLIATLLIFGLPWLWELLKPWLHAITA